MALSRWRRGRFPIILALVAGTLLIAFAGCGSSDGEQTGAGETSGSVAAQGSGASEAAGNQKEATKGTSGRAKKQPAGSNEGGSSKSGGSRRSGRKQGDTKQASGKKGSVCPQGISKAECKARIEAQTGSNQAPGQAVSSPSDCTKVMSEARCKEILSQQKAAAEEADKSVSPQTCLQEYSRKFCEEHFKQQAEQQAAAQAGN